MVKENKNEGGRPEINILFKWKPKTDKVEKVANSIRVLDEIQMFSGMSEKEMDQDLAGKKKVLEWLLSKNIKEVNDVGKIITEYYIDKETVLDLVESERNLPK